MDLIMLAALTIVVMLQVLIVVTLIRFRDNAIRRFDDIEAVLFVDSYDDDPDPAEADGDRDERPSVRAVA